MNNILATLLLICHVKGNSIEIKDLNNDPFVILKTRDCRIQTGVIKIVHPVHLAEIEKKMMELEVLIEDNLNEETSYYESIKYKMSILKDKITHIMSINRETRAIAEWYGSFFKWIGGTPDAEGKHKTKFLFIASI